MGTPKKPCCEVEGFIHKVSPVLKSRSGDVNYFSAVFQEATRNSRLVVFDVQRHNQFQCVEKDYYSTIKVYYNYLQVSNDHTSFFFIRDG